MRTNGPSPRARARALAIGLALIVSAGCAAHRPRADAERAFRFPNDTFDFANETIWEYDVEPATGHVAWRRREPRPAFALRCGAMARAARQFHAGARFDPTAAPVDDRTYARLVRTVLGADPRQPVDRQTVIPAYPDLRSFSRQHEEMLKTALAGPWQSYLQRGNWRMIFPFTARHQAGAARELLDALDAGWPPIVHLLRYPNLTINHLVLVFSAEETPTEIRFHTYDANDSSRSVLLTYDRAARAFSYDATAYFPGGPVKAYEVYDGLVY